MRTIAAISTPEAVGGISVVRISGNEAFAVAEKIFNPKGKKIAEMHGYTAAFGHITDTDGSMLDEGILTVFRSPYSYTGEDIAEISCHGGLFVTKKLLRLALENGAVPAEPGEFTKRAFLNGKMPLSKAESVMDIISASGQLELKSAVNLQESASFKKIISVRNSLTGILAELAVWADYPDEEDIAEIDRTELSETLQKMLTDLHEVLLVYDNGILLRGGIFTVIAGKPNVGKSSLMNCLAGTDRSIVTDIPGTTRDIIEETVILDDVKLRLADTAGLHDTVDPVENLGIIRAEKSIANADLTLAVFDLSAPITHADMEICEKLAGMRAIAVLNKADLPIAADENFIIRHFKNSVRISAVNGFGIDGLKECIRRLFIGAGAAPEILTNERQRAALSRALIPLESAVKALNAGEFFDIITVILDEALGELLELTGQRVTDTVVDEVFARFCVGK
ncbi:MAG: tRNA uridine-5-carboxymethylaminomethyl(34) synthesis GTPase MnmE [Oscillospiraceae bacterium]|jgi:tRNA modification GTPase|nr:tRNA uridine-5-carboxymethylaminomethyl(34) synthesis GTPase MnmE [Oscillospiraceae bacterium]